MKEVKPSKKPLAIYYAIVLAVLLLLNLVLLPWMSERQVEEVDYGTFMTMTEEKNIGRVDIESNQIIFTDKEEKQVYKTGLMNDPENHVQLLLDKDVKAGEFIGCHPCINTSSLKLYTNDIFEKFLPAVHHEPIFVELTGE